MALLPYYICHTFVNGIKKLFRTWVAIFLLFIVFCGLMGGVVGVGLGIALDEEDDALADSSLPEDGEEDDALVPDVVLDDGTEIWLDGRPLEGEILALITQLASAALFLIALVALLGTVYFADKSGSKIFTMPDVNLLFVAPLRPQSVLHFRLVLGIGALLIGSLYFLLQLPNLVLNLGLPWPVALALLAAWALLVVLLQMVKVLTYSLVSGCRRMKISPNRLLVIAIAVLLLGLYAYRVRVLGVDWFEAVLQLFGGRWLRAVPFVGWLSGVVLYVAEGRWLLAALCAAGTLLGSAALGVVAGLVPVDFYEDALPGAEANLAMAEAKAGKKQGLQQRSGPFKRSEKKRQRMQREKGIAHGQGAQMFLLRSLYHRSRNAFLGLFTGTCITYTLLCAGYCALAAGVLQSNNVVWLFGILLYIVFFRTLGNPLVEELERHFLYLVPQTPFRKLFYSLAAGTANCLLDLLPGWLLTLLVLRAPLAQMALWLLLLVVMDFFISSVGLAANLLLPSGLAATIYSMFQIMLMVLLVLPSVIALIVCYVLESPVLGLALASALCLLPGVCLVAISSLALEKGKL